MEMVLYGSASSTADFKAFKCSKCKKYLSVPPVFICTNLKRKILNICGRCVVPKDSPSIRNEAFEAMAKLMKFPCSLSKSCSIKIAWGEAKEHESECIYRMVSCYLCADRYSMDEIKSHIMEYHPEQYIFNKTLVIGEQIITGKSAELTYVIELRERTYLVQVWKEKFLNVTVQSASSWIPNSFNISFIKNDKVISFKNMPTRDGCDWKYHDINIESVQTALNILMPEDTTSQFQMQLEIICEEDTCSSTYNNNRLLGRRIIY